MGVLHRLENLTGVGFCCLCYALGSNCGCSRATYQAPHGYGSMALWVPPKPSYAPMASSMMTTASTSMRAGPPPGFPAMGAPTPMDVSLASQSYNPLAHAGVGRGLQPQSTPGSTRPQAPGAIGLHHACPSAPPSINHLLPQKVTRHIQPPPYQQVVHPPRQVRFASPITKAEATTSQSQSVAKRGRPQTREQGCHQEPASHSRARRDRSSTQGPKT